MGKSKLSATFLLFLLLLAGKPAVSQGHEPAPSVALPLQAGPGFAWMSECVDCRHAFCYMGPRSLALDAESRPAIAYGGDYLYYARYNGTQWQIEIVDPEDGAGLHTSLALDADNHPHISYVAGEFAGPPGTSELRYAYHDGSSWQIQTLERSSTSYTALALAGDGTPRISYRGHLEDLALWYASPDGSGWRHTSVDFYGRSGEYVSLRLDTADHPHATYRGWEGLYYAHNPGGG